MRRHVSFPFQKAFNSGSGRSLVYVVTRVGNQERVLCVFESDLSSVKL